MFLEQGIFMCLYVLFHSATSLSPVFLEPGVFMCLYVLFHSAFVINRLPGTLLLMRCKFPIYNSYVSGHVHLTDRTNWSNQQRWTAGSVVNNEMWFSDWQRPGFGSCPLVHLTIERIGRIDNIEPPGLLSVMGCIFPIDNIKVLGRVHSTNLTNWSIRQAL